MAYNRIKMGTQCGVRTCPPLFHFSPELSVKVRKNRRTHIHTHTHTHTHQHQYRLLLMQSSECWHSNYAFFKRSYKSPHRATSSWQPNWSGIKPEEATVAPRAVQRRAKGTSAEQRAGSANQRVQRRALWVHLSRGQSWEVKGLRLGRGETNTALRTRRHCLAWAS